MKQLEIRLLSHGEIPTEFDFQDFERQITEEVDALKERLPKGKARKEKKHAPQGVAGIPPEIHWYLQWVVQHNDELAVTLHIIQLIKYLNTIWKLFRKA